MDELKIIDQYLADLQREFSSGEAKEHSYRPALKKLIEGLLPNIQAVNEPKRQKVGAPDFVFIKKDIKIGYLEAKDIDVNLDEIAKSEQMDRYSALENLILTNYLEFRFYNGKECYAKINLGHLGILGDADQIETLRRNYDQFLSLLNDFSIVRRETIKSPSELAKSMANLARYARSVFLKALEDESEGRTSLHEQFEEFKKELIHDLSYEQFSDLYAQTITYGFFAARYHDESSESFSRQEAVFLIPKSNQFLGKLFTNIAGRDIDDRVVWIVDELAELFNHTNIKDILASFNNNSKRHDPIIHFYETFLGEYDPKLRKSRGVYYTPEPVVKFIVNAVDEILKTEFGLKDGLADTSKIDVKVERNNKKVTESMHRVQVLDPAVGTGTFLNEVIQKIYSNFEGQQGIWQKYVEDHLLDRIHGFELLMASYAMCHLKLAITLGETGFNLNKTNKRLSVYLTNSLEEPKDYDPFYGKGIFDPIGLTAEANEANKIKRETPVMVVIGNPPYSVSSTNKGKWIEKLVSDYKKDLNEKNIQPLSDDYIKFIRFGEHLIEKNGTGILAYISNNSFIDGIIHRQMRKHLLETFDKIYILDLHGNAKKKEVSPDGSKDENVFDIMQGVSINIFVKTGKKKSNKLGELEHLEFFGKRNKKYTNLENLIINNDNWIDLRPEKKYQFFVPKDFSYSQRYNNGFLITDLFLKNSSGIKTEKDALVYSFSNERVIKVISDFTTKSEKQLIDEYALPIDGRDWVLSSAIKDIKENDIGTKQVLYKPFDVRFAPYTGKTKGIMAYPRGKINVNLDSNNICLLATKSYFQRRVSSNIFATRFVSDIHSISDQSYFFPLYIYGEILDEKQKSPNFSLEILSEFELKLRLKLHPFFKEIDEDSGKFCPEDLLDYIYAVLHSPSYREKYKEFLKIDFPRVPYPEDQKKFWELVRLGREIRLLHLLESSTLNKLITQYPVNGNNVVEKPYFELTDTEQQLGKVYINQTQYFENVPKIAWEFYIGGYQPSQKWLKDRKGRELSFEDILHYQKMIVAMFETDRLMKEIDSISI